MHETSVARSILDIVDRTAADHPGARVRVVHVSIGALAHIDDEALRFAFDVLKPETLSRGAELRIERERITGTCRSCGESFETDAPGTDCPACGGRGTDWRGEAESRVTAIDVEEAPGSGTMGDPGEDR